MCDSIDGKRPRQADPQRQWVRGCQALGRTAKWYRVSFWGDEKVRKLIVEMDAQLCEWRWIVGRANYSSVKLLKKSYRLDYQILSAQGVGGSTGCTGDAVFTKQTSLPWSTDTREPVKQETALGKGFWNWEGPFVAMGGPVGAAPGGCLPSVGHVRLSLCRSSGLPHTGTVIASLIFTVENLYPWLGVWVNGVILRSHKNGFTIYWCGKMGRAFWVEKLGFRS